MDNLVPDEISRFRRARRAGYRVRKLGDVSDAMRVSMVYAKDRQEARDILKDCYYRLIESFVSKLDATLELLRQLAFEWTPDSDLHRHVGLDQLLIAIDFVNEHGDALGADFSAYLSDCLNSAKARHLDVLEVQTEDEREYRPDWLGLAFNLRQSKEAGQPTDPERDADILDGMKFIVQALQTSSDKYSSLLEEEIRGFLDGESDTLPMCIERLIVLKGYLPARQILDSSRMELAVFVADEIKRLNGTDHWRFMLAAKVFVKCQSVCAVQVDRLLERPHLPDSDRRLLQERRRTLRDYGADKVGDAAGFARLYRKHKNAIDSQIKRSATDRTAEVKRIWSENETAKKRKEALECASVQEALAIIRSPDVGGHKQDQVKKPNEDRGRLKRLQKKTPKEYQHIWPELWDQFAQRIAKSVELQSN